MQDFHSIVKMKVPIQIVLYVLVNLVGFTTWCISLHILLSDYTYFT